MPSLMDSFFSFSKELQFDEQLDNGEYDSEQVIHYVHELLDCSVAYFLQYIRDESSVAALETSDMLVFSSIHDAMIKVPYILSGLKDSKGINALQLGRMLQNDGCDHQEGSFRKYGEQQGKLSVALGTARHVDKKFRPSALGQIIEKLNTDQQLRLRERLILRTREMQLIIHRCSQGPTLLRNVLSDLPSMFARQRTSFNALRRALDDSAEFNYVFLEKELNIK